MNIFSRFQSLHVQDAPGDQFNSLHQGVNMKHGRKDKCRKKFLYM